MSWKDFKISYSRINAYSFCPQKYKLIYIDNLYVPLNADITFGHIIHNSLESYHSQDKQTFEELIDVYIQNWKKDGFESPQQNFEYYERGKQILHNYFGSFKETESEILYTEKSFETNIGKYKFVGIIDRIDKHPDGTYEIIDYKTHSKIWEQEKVDKDIQLTFYVYACRNVLSINPNKVSVYFLSKNKKVYTQRTKEDIETALELSLDIAEKITNEDFTPLLEKCGQCDFKNKCAYSPDKLAK
ncbi:MAG: PD-(D/E)XK nuclease family protein [Elusimicrobiota bacterium]|nr:PD-(D/E)XK nuclease family protein [Elusimicrobiota bacterium]